MEQKTIHDTVNFNRTIANTLLVANPDVQTATVASHLQLLSVREVSRRLGVGHWMIYRLIGENKLKSISIGTRRLIPVQALYDFIMQCEGSQNG